MKKFLRKPKILLSIFLLLIFLSAITQIGIVKGLFILTACISFTILSDLLFSYFRKKPAFFPSAAIASSLIIALLINPNSPWYQIAMACAISMAFKNFFRPKNRHVFNPAAVGLSIGGIIFHQSVTWWGVSFQNIQAFSGLFFFILLLLPSYLSAYKLKRLFSIFSFIFVYNLLSILLGSFNENPIQRLFDPTVIFFSLVMLPEPITSPIKPRIQILYGIFTAALIIIFSVLPYFNILTTKFLIPDVFLLSLLISNAFFLKFRGV